MLNSNPPLWPHLKQRTYFQIRLYLQVLGVEFRTVTYFLEGRSKIQPINLGHQVHFSTGCRNQLYKIYPVARLRRKV